MDNEELILSLRLGNAEAKTLLVKNNLPLVKSIVKRYKGKQTEYDDLISLGLLGLVKAINNFDPSFGTKFSTYAVPMIAGEIKRFLRDDGAIKVSRGTKAQAVLINRFVENFRQEKGREPLINEIAAEFSLDEAETVFVLESNRYPVSIHHDDDDDGLPLEERIASNEPSLEERSLNSSIKEYITNLPERERRIIELRYYEDKTQSETARELNVSQVQVSRIEAKILFKMRTELA